MTARIYRRRTHQIGGWTFIVIVGMLTVSFVLGARRLAVLDAATLLSGAVLADLLVHRLYVRPRLIADDAVITVVNPVRTFLIPWLDVDRFVPEDILIIRTRSGPAVRVWAVQAPGIALMFRRESAPDRVAEELTKQLARVRKAHEKEIAGPPPAPRTKLQLAAIVFTGVVVAALVLRFVVLK